MAYKQGTAQGHLAFLDELRRWVCGFGELIDQSFTGAGAGTLEPTSQDPFTITRPGTVTEVWTVECTAAYDGGTEAPAVFSVTGSVSGAHDPATAGVDYDNGFLRFVIEDDEGQRFQVGDTFTIEVEQGEFAGLGEAWEEMRWRNRAPDGFPNDWEWIGKGPGLSGDDEIFVGIRSLSSVSGDWYNLELRAFTGYVEENSFTTQPGVSPARYVLMFQGGIPYHIVANGRRIIFGALVSTIYVHGYLGFYLPYATPNQLPYPIMVLGCWSGSESTRWSNSTTSHRFGYSHNPNRTFRHVNGEWQGGIAWPWSESGGGADVLMRPVNDDNDYTVLPIMLYETSPSNILGELDGVYHITGFGNSTADVISINGTDYVVLQDIFRTGFNNYIALRAE